MSSGILGTAVSGLMAFQRSLSTTSHNIANVNTEGYSRQRVELATRPAQFTGAGYIGQGVKVNDIRRIYDNFINAQLRASTSAFGDVSRYHELGKQIDNILADPDTGMAPAIKTFFNAVNEFANDPSSIPARQVMLSEAEILTNRFNTMNQRFEDLRSQVNKDLSVMINDLNALATSIADLNDRIVTDFARAGSRHQSNDLIDQRDLMLSKLAELVDISVLAQENGSVSVFIGQGQSLVQGSRASPLSLTRSDFDPMQLGVAINGNQEIGHILSGGKLSGTLRFRNEILDPAQAKLGQVAASLALEFNALHEKGYDLDGRPGKALFSGVEQVFVRPHVANTTSAITVTYDPKNISRLDYSDYRLDYDGTDYFLTRMTDQSRVVLTEFVDPDDGLTYLVPADPTQQLPGIRIALDTMDAGESFLLRPAFPAAGLIGVNIRDTRKLAAATNIQVDPRTGRTLYRIDPTANPTDEPYASNPNLLDPVTGQPYLLDADGQPLPAIHNGPMPGDNRNALAMAALEHKLGMLGGNASFKDAYGQLVAQVGTLTHAADMSRSAQEVLLNQARASRENLSGVNLDEEAANLIKFQQAYQAAAQLIAATNTLFDTLIGAVR